VNSFEVLIFRLNYLNGGYIRSKKYGLGMNFGLIYLIFKEIWFGNDFGAFYGRSAPRVWKARAFASKPALRAPGPFALFCASGFLNLRCQGDFLSSSGERIGIQKSIVHHLTIHTSMDAPEEYGMHPLGSHRTTTRLDNSSRLIMNQRPGINLKTFTLIEPLDVIWVGMCCSLEAQLLNVLNDTTLAQLPLSIINKHTLPSTVQ